MRLLHCRLFALVSRYSALAADKSAFQAALPRPMMRLLKERWGVTHECYASPLNRCPPRLLPPSLTSSRLLPPSLAPRPAQVPRHLRLRL